ncbi:unnamed protein product [Rhizoctonia solani]|uniref:Uncharacterized protein n=1 Tax=Rhizoctonia solani TaxID=456999 RepID=A0A8H2WRF1_9AGAM|nr:unnamed protein product [Rhizoctonia solani]
MEARRQYYDPVRDSRAGEQYFPLDPELLSGVVFNHRSDIQIEPHPPAGQDALQLLPIHQSPADESQLHVDDSEDRTTKIEFSTQWSNRKEAVWDIVGTKRGTQALVSAPAPQARAAPRIWAEVRLHPCFSTRLYFESNMS